LIIVLPLGANYNIHFRDIRRLANINHFNERLSKARHVINATLQYNLLTAIEHQTLLQFRFESFNSNLLRPTVSTLNELLDENWLGEHVIDACIDILRRDLTAVCGTEGTD
jgi:hypothetical protein